MLDFLANFSPIVQTLFGTGFTYAMTALGAGMVFFTKNLSRKTLDGMLGFAAGAMIFVVAEEVIPEAQAEGNNHISTAGVMIGFAVMMTLDVALG